MRPYEFMLILDASLEEETIRAAVGRITDTIKANGGEPGALDHWGRRRLAYEIRYQNRGHWEGHYVVMQARAEPQAAAEVSRVLSLADEVIRHRVVQIPELAWGHTRPMSAAAPAEG